MCLRELRGIHLKGITFNILYNIDCQLFKNTSHKQTNVAFSFIIQI